MRGRLSVLRHGLDHGRMDETGLLSRSKRARLLSNNTDRKSHCPRKIVRPTEKTAIDTIADLLAEAGYFSSADTFHPDGILWHA